MAVLDHVHYVVEHASEISTLVTTIATAAPMVVGVASVLAMLLPKPRRRGTMRWRARRVLDVVACNARNARNASADDDGDDGDPPPPGCS